MTIKEAAKATRRYWPAPDWELSDYYIVAHSNFDPENAGARYSSYAEAQAVCDRLNFRAVLEELLPAVVREIEMIDRASRMGGFWTPESAACAMIDALITECGGGDA